MSVRLPLTLHHDCLAKKHTAISARQLRIRAVLRRATSYCSTRVAPEPVYEHGQTKLRRNCATEQAVQLVSSRSRFTNTSILSQAAIAHPSTRLSPRLSWPSPWFKAYTPSAAYATAFAASATGFRAVATGMPQKSAAAATGMQPKSTP